MELTDVLAALVHHQKQISYHHAQSMRALADYATVCEGDEFADAEIAAENACWPKQPSRPARNCATSPTAW